MQFFYIFEIRIIIMCFFRYTKSTKIETLAIEFFCNKRYRSDITDYGIAGSTYLIKGNCSRQKTVPTLQIDLLANTDCFWPLSFVSMLISGWLADIIAAVLSYFTKRLKNICVRPPPIFLTYDAMTMRPRMHLPVRFYWDLSRPWTGKGYSQQPAT